MQIHLTNLLTAQSVRAPARQTPSAPVEGQAAHKPEFVPLAPAPGTPVASKPVSAFEQPGGVRLGVALDISV
jgi:hypothetical protein